MVSEDGEEGCGREEQRREEEENRETLNNFVLVSVVIGSVGYVWAVLCWAGQTEDRRLQSGNCALSQSASARAPVRLSVCMSRGHSIDGWSGGAAITAMQPLSSCLPIDDRCRNPDLASALSAAR